MTITALNSTNYEFTLVYQTPLYKSKRTLGCDSHSTYYIFFFLVSSRELLHWSHILWIVVGKKSGWYLSSSHILGAGEKKG